MNTISIWLTDTKLSIACEFEHIISIIFSTLLDTIYKSKLKQQNTIWFDGDHER